MGPSVSFGGTWLETLRAEPSFSKTECTCSGGFWDSSLLLSWAAVVSVVLSACRADAVGVLSIFASRGLTVDTRW